MCCGNQREYFNRWYNSPILFIAIFKIYKSVASLDRGRQRSEGVLEVEYIHFKRLVK
jgi:hypothetical protein